MSGLFFWRHLPAEPKIPTDWLTADWHEKEEPRRRRRRNVLPDAYRALSKSDRQKVRAAAKWIRQRVSHVDWGRRMPDSKAGKPLPKPVNFKEQVLRHVQKSWDFPCGVAVDRFAVRFQDNPVA